MEWQKHQLWVKLTLTVLIIETFLWSNTNKRSFFISVPPFAEWTGNVLQKSYSVNMCIIIHSSECIVCLLWPHFQRAQKQAGGVGSQNKSLSSPPVWASEMLTTQPAQSLSLGFWPPMSDSWITKNFSKVQGPGDYTVKIFLLFELKSVDC